MSLSSLIPDVKKTLGSLGVPSADVDADSLIAYALRLERNRLYLEPERPISPTEHARILDLVRERGKRVPLQYLTGGCEFMSLPFRLKRGVFIPRPESETLVEALATAAARSGRPVRRLLDIGTGCGVMAISLAKSLKPDFVLGSDISTLAVGVAKENAALNGVAETVCFVAGDCLSFMDVDRLGPRGKRFDIIACNPPYVESGQIAGLEPEVRDHEPGIAIDGGEDGLRFFAGTIPQIPSILSDGGIVGFEIGETQADQVSMIFRESGLGHIEVLKDLCGRDRAVIGRRR